MGSLPEPEIILKFVWNTCLTEIKFDKRKFQFLLDVFGSSFIPPLVKSHEGWFLIDSPGNNETI